MTVAFIDSTVVVHLYRKNQLAIDWLEKQPTLSISSTTWLEMLDGCTNTRILKDTVNILRKFELVYPNQADIDWAIAQTTIYRLSHGIGANDCMIASVCHRLQVPLYTHNLKHMSVILNKNLVIKPY